MSEAATKLTTVPDAGPHDATRLIPEFTLTDFTDTDKPYAWLYEQRDNPFLQQQLLGKMNLMAKRLKFPGFLGIWKKYLEAREPKQQILGDFVTMFPDQPVQMRSGKYVCDQFGIAYTGRMGEEIEVCSHPLMPVKRIVNIDTNEEKLEIAYSRGGKWRTMIAGREQLASAQKVIALARNGIAVNSENHVAYDAENICTACFEYKDKGVVFTLENGTYTVTDYTGNAEEVIIPAKYKNIPVTCIGEQAFSECKTLRYITIPASVTTIGEFAFYRCSALQEIVLPHGVTSVGKSAFYHCSAAKKITLPTSLIHIGQFAFDDCAPTNYTTYQNGKYWGSTNNPYLYLADVVDDTVTSFDIPDATRFIGSKAFFCCNKLESIEIPDTVVGINTDAFYACRSLKTVTFSANAQLTLIGSWAFCNCAALESIIIPASVKTVGFKAFDGCEKLSSATFAAKSGWLVSLYDDPASGQPVSATVLANTANAAECLTVNYAEYYWFRSE